MIGKIDTLTTDPLINDELNKLETKIKALLEKEGLSESPILSFVLNKMADDFKTGGTRWPINAKYAVKYNSSTTDSIFSSVEFFKTEEDLNLFLEKITKKCNLGKKSNLKDKELSMKVFEWKFGPQEIVEKAINPDNLSNTYREQKTLRTELILIL